MSIEPIDDPNVCGFEGCKRKPANDVDCRCSEHTVEQGPNEGSREYRTRVRTKVMKLKPFAKDVIGNDIANDEFIQTTNNLDLDIGDCFVTISYIGEIRGIRVRPKAKRDA